MENEDRTGHISRREMLAGTAMAVTAMAITKVTGLEAAPTSAPIQPVELAGVSFRVNGKAITLEMDTRTTLLDALREKLFLTGT